MVVQLSEALAASSEGAKAAFDRLFRDFTKVLRVVAVIECSTAGSHHLTGKEVATEQS